MGIISSKTGYGNQIRESVLSVSVSVYYAQRSVISLQTPSPGRCSVQYTAI
jgi:hypothetical protein